MKYIKRIILDNFQSHKYSILELDERLNVIVGPSDSGKSSIIRGIKWALYNEPSGDYFIREREKECSVTLEFNDSTQLKRYRSKSKNLYILINNKGEEFKFEGFGSNVPIEIIDAIGIEKIYLNSDESDSINLGEQLEGPFLLSKKTSTRASAIGRLVGVNIIDDSLREVLKDIRGLNISQKDLEKDVKALSDEIKKYEYLDDLKFRLEKAEKLKSVISNTYTRLNKLIAANNKFIDINKELNQTNKLLHNLKSVDELNQITNTIEKYNLNYKYLNNYNYNLNKIKESIYENRLIILKLKDINYILSISSRIDEFYYLYSKIIILQKKNTKNQLEKSKLDYTIRKLSNLTMVNNNIQQISNINLKLAKLINYNIMYKNVLKGLQSGNIYLDKLSNLELLKSNIKNIEENFRLLNKLYNIYELTATNHNEKEDKLKSIILYKQTIGKQLENYQDLLRKIEICPFCLSNIDEIKIEHIIDHYIGG